MSHVLRPSNFTYTNAAKDMFSRSRRQEGGSHLSREIGKLKNESNINHIEYALRNVKVRDPQELFNVLTVLQNKKNEIGELKYNKALEVLMSKHTKNYSKFWEKDVGFEYCIGKNATDSKVSEETRNDVLKELKRGVTEHLTNTWNSNTQFATSTNDQRKEFSNDNLYNQVMNEQAAELNVIALNKFIEKQEDKLFLSGKFRNINSSRNRENNNPLVVQADAITLRDIMTDHVLLNQFDRFLSEKGHRNHMPFLLDVLTLNKLKQNESEFNDFLDKIINQYKLNDENPTIVFSNDILVEMKSVLTNSNKPLNSLISDGKSILFPILLKNVKRRALNCAVFDVTKSCCRISALALSRFSVKDSKFVVNNS